MKALLTVPLPRLIQDPPRYPDLGLGYLARHLEANGHEVFIHGWNSRLTPAEFSGMLRELEPDVVGIKVFTHNFNAVRATMALISQTLPQTPIILGGPHVSATEPKEIFIDFPMTSYALRGEAEATLPTLLMHLQGRSVSLNDIPGLVWMEKQQVKFNSPVWTKNLDELGQPAWEKLYSNRTDHKLGRWQRQKSAPLTASRGCPGSCAFCSVHKISGNRVRSRSAEAILEEIEYLAGRYRVQNFIFMDTNFLFDRELTVAICEGILGRQLRVSWDCVSDYSWYKCDPQLYRLMHRSGCRVMQVGIESGSDRVRRWLGQVESVREVREQIMLLQKSGIEVNGWFLIGFPDETRHEIQQTIDLAFSMNLSEIFLGLCFPLPGTRVYEWLKQKYSIKQIEWESFNLMKSPYPLAHVSSEELTKIWKSVQTRIFWHPSAWRPQLIPKRMHNLINKVARKLMVL